jgi:hypothetical protein
MSSPVPPQFPGETQSPYDFTTLRPSRADMEKFGHAGAVLRLLNYQFHGQHDVDYHKDIMFHSHHSTTWTQLLDALKESISTIQESEPLADYIEELIAACRGELHEQDVKAARVAAAQATEIKSSYSETGRSLSPLLLAETVQQEKTRAPRPKAKMKNKALDNLDSSSAKKMTMVEENEEWMKANRDQHQVRAKARASRAKSSSSTSAAKNRFDDPSPGVMPTRSDISRDVGLSVKLKSFYNAETSEQSRLHEGVFRVYVVHGQAD